MKLPRLFNGRPDTSSVSTAALVLTGWLLVLSPITYANNADVRVDARARISAERPITPYLFGYNGNLTTLDRPWRQTPLLGAASQLAPANLRYPGGSVGNYWDWSTGWFDLNADRGRFIRWARRLVSKPHRYTLDDLAHGQRALGFEPIYMLNMVTQSLDDQRRALGAADELGLPVRLIELGNEFYFGRTVEPLVHQRYPEVSDYAAAANRWAAALKQSFPQARFAAIASTGGEAHHSARRRHWNERLLPLLSDDIDALTVHVYVDASEFAKGTDTDAGRGRAAAGKQPWLRQRAALAEPQRLSALFALPRQTWHDIRDQLAVAGTAERELWVTEFNVNDGVGGLRHSWAHGLTLAALIDQLLAEPRVSLMSFHNLYGGRLFPAVHGHNTFANLETARRARAWSLTATGKVMAAYARSAIGQGQAYALAFDHTGGVAPSLSGWLFAPGPEAPARRALLVNYSAQTVTVELPPDTLTNAAYQQRWAPPSDYIGETDNLRQTLGRLRGRVVTLKPYSLTTIGRHKNIDTAANIALD